MTPGVMQEVHRNLGVVDRLEKGLPPVAPLVVDRNLIRGEQLGQVLLVERHNLGQGALQEALQEELEQQGEHHTTGLAVMTVELRNLARAEHRCLVQKEKAHNY